MLQLLYPSFQTELCNLTSCSLLDNRLWDIRKNSCVQSHILDSPATSIELSRDRKCLTVAHGSNVTVIDSER